MIYIDEFTLPSDVAEYEAIKHENRTCLGTFYPFNIFPLKELKRIKFDGITMLYGGNGSGKSTLINLIAKKVDAVRYSDFNDAPLFDKYADMCSVSFTRSPENCCVLTSDDVFDYALSARAVNENIDDRRNELMDKYREVHREIQFNPEIGRLTSLDDYERWKETREILSRRRSMSSYVKNRVERDVDLLSNGQTAMRYFIDRIDEDAVYILDEPENSLSIELQIKLADYIAATARSTRSQFIIATHSPVLLSMKGAKIYNLDSVPVGVCKWTELPNVRRYFEFFMDHSEEFEG